MGDNRIEAAMKPALCRTNGTAMRDQEDAEPINARRDDPPRRRPPRFAILYHDAELLIVNKPAGVPLHGLLPDEPGILDLLPEGLLPPPDPNGASGLPVGEPIQAAYPLDASVSGAVVLPRTAHAQRQLRAFFDGGAVEMACLAIVRGRVEADSGELELPISHHVRDGEPFHDPRHGARTKTRWRVRDRFVAFTLVECLPQPPVPRYVRMHLQAADMPLAVDHRYGGATQLMLSSFKAGYQPSRRHAERPLIHRTSIHVQSVSLTHPATGRSVSIQAPPPKDFRATLHQLDRFGRLPR